MTPGRWPWATLLLLVWCWTVAASPPPVVTAIEVRAQDLGVPVAELTPLIAVQIGEELREEETRRTLRGLRASGWLSQVELLTRPDEAREDGVRVILVLHGVPAVREVELVGELGLNERRLTAAIVPMVGLPLVEERVARSREELLKLLRRRGFLRARVTPRVVSVAEGAVRIELHVDAGARARIRRLTLEGELGPVTEGQLRQRLRRRVGDPFDARRGEKDAQRMLTWLRDQGFLTAQVDPPRVVELLEEVEGTEVEGTEGEEAKGEGGQVEVTYAVQVGPLVEVVGEGIEVGALRRRRLLSFLTDAGYDRALLEASQARILRDLQERGYYQAQVTVFEERDAQRIRVHVRVERGEEHTLRQLTFEGHETFPAERLAELLATAPVRALSPGSGRLVTEVLEADLVNLRSFYALEGFENVRIGEPRVTLDGTDIFLAVPVEEGVRSRVANLTFVSAGPLPLELELAELPLEVGSPYHARFLEDAIGVIRARGQRLGIEWIQITPRLHRPAAGLVEVTLEVLPGPQLTIDRVVVRGNSRTLTSVVRRVAGLEPGQWLDRRRLLEAERSLVRLGVFARVDISVAAAEEGRDGRDVVIQVEEGRVRRVAYGLGYDSDDGARGLLGFSHNNLFGRAFRLRLDARASGRDERFRVIFDQPNVGRFETPVSYSIFRFDEDRESFEQRSEGARIEVQREVPAGRLGLVFDYRRIDLTDVEIPLNEIERRDRELEVSSLIPNLLLDRRDDPFDPAEGWSLALQLQYAFPAFSTDASFLKLFTQQTAYGSLGRFGTLAGSLRFGAIEPLDSVSAVGSDADNPVPIGERFFAGGRTTHRAFERDLLGVPNETLVPVPDGASSIRQVPVGGNGLLIANLEYRFPLAGDLGGTLFVDAGNVWRDWRDFDFDEVRPGVGLGLRYSSPVGPVRLEVGWKLDREPGESSAEVFLSIGNPF